MTWRAWVRPQTILFLSLWVILLVGGRSRFFQDPGTFWHTRVGERIYTQGFFDKDPYTFTFAGATWIPHQWLGECLMALVHAWGGLDSLLLFTTAALALLFTRLGQRLIDQGLHPTVAIVLTALAVAASSGHFHVRPHLATMFGMAITTILLSDVETNRCSLNRLFWLIPIYIIWANIHGGILGGLASLGLVFSGWIITWRLGKDSPLESSRDLLKLITILVLCSLGCLVNPYGWRIPAVWFDIYRMEALPRMIKEHSPLNLAERNAWVVLVLGLVYLVACLLILPTRPRISWVLPIVWLCLSILRVRHAPLFAISAIIFLADILPWTRVARYWKETGSDLYTPPDPYRESIPLRVRLFAWAIPAGIFVWAALLQFARIDLPVFGHGWAELDAELWPVALLEPLKKHQDDRPGGTRIFNEFAYGGFLIYQTPGYRVFVDDRCELFGEAWLAMFLDAPHLDPEWSIERWQEKYGEFDLALVSTRAVPGFCQVFENSDQWVLIEKTNTASLFKRK